MWYRKAEEEMLPMLKELGIAFVPFSPLGKGVLTGRFKRGEQFDTSDYRSKIPRFQSENLDRNLLLVDYITEAAKQKGVTNAQFALGWLMAQHPWLVPIPGTKKVSRLEENIGAADITFSTGELSEIRKHIESIEIYGARYPEEQEKLTGL